MLHGLLSWLMLSFWYNLRTINWFGCAFLLLLLFLVFFCCCWCCLFVCLFVSFCVCIFSIYLLTVVILSLFAYIHFWSSGLFCLSGIYLYIYYITYFDTYTVFNVHVHYYVELQRIRTNLWISRFLERK